MNDRVKQMIDSWLSKPNGEKNVAHHAAAVFRTNPALAASDLRMYVPVDKLPDVIFQLAAEYVMAGIDPRDETPGARKIIQERTATLRKYFSVEMEEGGRRVAAKIRR